MTRIYKKILNVWSNIKSLFYSPPTPTHTRTQIYNEFLTDFYSFIKMFRERERERTKNHQELTRRVSIVIFCYVLKFYSTHYSKEVLRLPVFSEAPTPNRFRGRCCHYFSKITGAFIDQIHKRQDSCNLLPLHGCSRTTHSCNLPYFSQFSPSSL